LLSYIQDRELHPDANTREMILRAISAYYMPLALSNEGSKTAAHIEQIGIDSIFALLRQVDRICAALGLDRSKFGGIVPMGVGMWSTAGGAFNTRLPASMPTPERQADIEEDFDPDRWNIGGLSTHSEVFSD
ncbi:hypothetical protein IQ272_32880, partial [Chroococcidiopsidales cyanobacterium LEGE 13417]|nr:hypothetical protein [Chroococcidiopsidales cyanobacterium LEGE 13417]